MTRSHDGRSHFGQFVDDTFDLWWKPGRRQPGKVPSGVRSSNRRKPSEAFWFTASARSGTGGRIADLTFFYLEHCFVEFLLVR
jgi:hypothetical protein